MSVSSGYSGTPLLKKLGIRPDMKLLLFHQPPDYNLLLETSIASQICKGGEIPDLVHVFAESLMALKSAMKEIEPLISRNPQIIIWISWYKKSAKISTDITEDLIRNDALARGLVDIKVCAVSDIWSGLKLVVPKALR